MGHTGVGFGDIAFTEDGRLWGIASGNLYQIDTLNADTTWVGNFGLSCVSLVGLNDSVLLTESGQKLYGIRTANATAYLIGHIGYQAAGDLTWYDNDLYMVTSVGKIVRIELNPQATAVTGVSVIGNAIPTCEGAVTLPFVGQYNSLLGFYGPNLIKICHTDGSYEMLCPNVHIGGTPGAAALRLPLQNPLPQSCIRPSGDTEQTSARVLVYPNPARNYFTVSCNGYPAFTYTLYNLLGQVQQSGSYNAPTATINTIGLPAGVYIVSVATGEKNHLQKIIIDE